MQHMAIALALGMQVLEHWESQANLGYERRFTEGWLASLDFV